MNTALPARSVIARIEILRCHDGNEIADLLRTD
jgi:hypothetical protein